MSPPTKAYTAQELLAALASVVTVANASDIHLRTGFPPYLRAGGRVAPVQAPPLDGGLITALVRMTAGELAAPMGTASWEYSFDHGATLRFRAHVFTERGQPALCLRVIPARIPTFSELRLPPVIKTLATSTPGLVLVTGPTGSGKSTTLGAMLQHLAQSEMIHLLSVEDPVEYRLSANSSCITQREVGRDCASLHDGLVQAMLEDPDALFIGEIRTAESLEVAMQAAETGHAVFSSFHTGSALKTVMRVISMYPSDEQLSARARLADCLRAVVCQMLVARKGVNARVLTTEVMVNNYRVKECIRDPARTAALPQVLEKSREQGMHTFDEDMMLMVRDGVITVDTALAHAASPNDLRRALSLAGVAA